jgi:hypothetical protein
MLDSRYGKTASGRCESDKKLEEASNLRAKLYRKTPKLYRKVIFPFKKVSKLYRKTSKLYRKVIFLYRKTPKLYRKVFKLSLFCFTWGRGVFVSRRPLVALGPTNAGLYVDRRLLMNCRGELRTSRPPAPHPIRKNCLHPRH